MPVKKSEAVVKVAKGDFLTISNTGGITLNNDVTVSQTLALGANKITTGANKVIANGSVTRSTGYVLGNLRKPVATGATAPTFEIGDASTYAPVSIAFGNVTAAGTLTASTTQLGGAPAAGGLPTGTALSQTKYVKRKWTVTNDASSVAFNNYSATLGFAAADVQGGANTNNLVVSKLDGSTWTQPAVGTRTPTTTQATGMTSFSDFNVGEPQTFTLTYTAGANGTISGTTPQTVTIGQSGSAVTAVANTGYHFVNWSDGSTANTRTDASVSANVSVTASFAINTYTLTYTAGANGTISGTTPQTVNYNASGSAVTAVANTG